ncbi:uncharacterized protein BKCO1_10000165 [Diplodia corticola]|uniref:DUF202 domain-containing protein n=1 Tax=Diplodia corticola TaxID=236234 RepID=A0A1J9S9U1_9PEZI|nr:uncharacterized protein BKCO1_10000165 [Diplodia corticola]OJD36660.1 hypothetical protein BKCO1_10000165 [Diplodia corticola]
MRPATALLLPLRAPVYANTGSVARDHLASERTYLAWLRTGLGFVALGIGVERFSRLDLGDLLAATTLPRHTRKSDDHQSDGDGETKNNGGGSGSGSGSFKEESSVLVEALLGTGTGCIAYGTTRYFENMRLLERGLFRPAYYGAGALGVAVAGLAGGVYWSAVRDGRNNGRGGSGEEV